MAVPLVVPLAVPLAVPLVMPLPLLMSLLMSESMSVPLELLFICVFKRKRLLVFYGISVFSIVKHIVF